MALSLPNGPKALSMPNGCNERTTDCGVDRVIILRQPSSCDRHSYACRASSVVLCRRMILDHLPDVQALAPDEKWQLLDELWKDLARTVESTSPDAATIALLEAREAEYQSDPDAVRTWADVQTRLAEHKLARRLAR